MGTDHGDRAAAKDLRWAKQDGPRGLPLIDNDPHFKRVIGYARTSDYAVGGLAALSGPGLMYAVEKFAPSHARRGAFPKIMRLAGAIGITGGFLIFYQRSILRFY